MAHEHLARYLGIERLVRPGQGQHTQPPKIKGSDAEKEEQPTALGKFR
jgi:hypothetical protein